MSRAAEIARKTAETDIRLRLDLDGAGQAEIATGVGFYDHLLTHVARHGLFDLTVRAEGDLHIDEHHTVEDVAICLGQALRQALGDKAGIVRYGTAYVPMDEALVRVALDLSGRPYLVCDLGEALPAARIGGLGGTLVEHAFQSFAVHGGVTLHVARLAGRDPHHIAEAAFKALGRALRQAVARDPREGSVPSTKGVL